MCVGPEKAEYIKYGPICGVQANGCNNKRRAEIVEVREAKFLRYESASWSI